MERSNILKTVAVTIIVNVIKVLDMTKGREIQPNKGI